MNNKKASIIAHILNLALLISLFAFCVYVFDALPDRYPTHYNFSGQPDRWADKSLLGWLSVPIVFVFITTLFYALALALPLFASRPNWVNFPPKSKEKFLAMSLENRKTILKNVSSFLYWLPVPLLVMILWMRHLESQFIILKLETFNGLWGLSILPVGLTIIIILMIKDIKRTINTLSDNKP